MFNIIGNIHGLDRWKSLVRKDATNILKKSPLKWRFFLYLYIRIFNGVTCSIPGRSCATLGEQGFLLPRHRNTRWRKGVYLR